MNKHMIYRYIKNLRVDDVKKIALKQDIFLGDEEALGVYNYIMKNYDNFFEGNINIDDVIHDAYLILNKDNYDKAYLIYLKYRDKI